MIVGARLKGAFDLATMTGWQAERFARTKTMKAMGHYLGEGARPVKKRATGAREVKQMFERFARRQAAEGRKDPTDGVQ